MTLTGAISGRQREIVLRVASAAALFLGAMFNVAELLLAKEELGGGETGFGVLVTIYGVGYKFEPEPR